MINFYVRGKVRRLRAFSMAKEHWFRTWVILRELAVFNKKLSVYYVATRLSRDECNAQQIRAALRRSLAHKSLSKSFDLFKLAKKERFCENIREKREQYS